MYKQLIEKAIRARELSYSPYSKFKVGSALLCSSGKIYTGCNIENVSYTPTICAERTAIFKAISEGEKEFEVVAIVGGFDEKIDFCYPCGVCRQVLKEFVNSDFKIIVAKSLDNYKVYTMNELLPFSFTLEK